MTDSKQDLKLRLLLNPENPQELLCLIYAQEQLISRAAINLAPWPGNELFYFWMLHACKDVFYQYLPVAKVEGTIQEQLPAQYPAILPTLSKFINTIVNTSKFIEQHLHLKPVIRTHTKILLYNVDKNPFFYELYQSMEQQAPDLVLYEAMQTGWNVHQRQFDKVPVLSADAMLQLLMDRQITRIVHINTHYLDHLLAHEQFHFLAVCVALGFEWVTLQNDPGDLVNGGFLGKSGFHHAPFTSFSTFPHLCQYWDTAFDLKNISYVPVYRKKSPAIPPTELADDYQLLLYTNSRMGDVVSELGKICRYYSLLDPHNIFQDFQQLYHAARFFLLTTNEIDQTKKLALESILAVQHAGFYNFSKYLVIDHLIKQSRRPVVLFGDTNWGKIFPEAYQNKYLNDQEINQLFATGRYVQIIPCTNYSYFENNPVYPKALLAGIPFLGFPPVIQLPEIAGLSAIECPNLDVLLAKADDYKPWQADPHLQGSIDCFRHLTNQCLDEFTAKALDLERKTPSTNTFTNIAHRSDAQFDLTVRPYLARNRDRVIELLNFCITGCPPVDVRTHPLAEYAFVRKLLALQQTS